MVSKRASNGYLDGGSTPSKARLPPRSPGPSPSKGKIIPKDYTSEGVRNNDILNLPSSDWQLLAGLTVVALFVRLFRIYQPSSVVFDEVHFGGFATKYIKGKFFMDVHPPLAKMLIALFGWLAGFNGDFDFKDIGMDYLGPGVPYVAMRLYPALCGVMNIPTVFLTLKATGCRTTSAALGAGCIIFENGLLTNNRLILLDSPLVTATAFTALAWTNFSNQHELGPTNAFTPSWWFWLAATGFCLGATVSIKWVGLFTIGWVGSITALQLWVLLGDPRHVTPRLWFKHLFARAFCLIVVPITFYLACFAIHFTCLVNPGDGDGFMSSEFQSTLNNKGMQDVPADVAFGSRISLRHHNTQGGYLHSHNHMYPEGSKQQQITLYPHKDENNVWLLENQTQPEGLDGPITGPKAWDAIDATHIKDGDVIKLYHAITDRRLHSHDQRPPVTEADWQQEVSAYGYEGFEGDANDMFKVEIIKSMSDGKEAKERLRTIQSKFRLVHIMTGCVLFSHKVKLPEWGFEQQEVTCAKGGTVPNSVWYVEENAHPQLNETSEKVNYRNPGFLGKFIELNRVMWTTNAGLVESHAWDSRPSAWPILKRGINFWGKDHRQIYLMGNPVIWFSSTAAIAVYLGIKALSILRYQRGYTDHQIQVFKRFDYELGPTVLGWAFHYFPFYLMSRQLFLHHYFPALYLAVIALCQLFDFVTFRFEALHLKQRPAIGQAAAVAFIALTIFAFTMYAPLSYGNVWTKDACKKTQFMKGWDWDCNNFLDTYADYDSYVPVAATSSASSAPAVAQDAANAASPANSDGGVTPEPAALPQINPDPDVVIAEGDGHGNDPILGQEESVEFRDENGNLLNEEQVAALEGKVDFQTKYETRTRLVDERGEEVGYRMPDGRVKDEQAPPHPDVENVDSETKGRVMAEKSVAAEAPATVDAEIDEQKQASVLEEERKRTGEARPGSERDEATGKGQGVAA